MSVFSLGTTVYNRFETFAHDTFRKMFVKAYSTGQYTEAKKNFSEWKPLSRKQKKEIAQFWGIKHPQKSDYYTHEVMLNVKGEFDVRYCPEKIFKVYLCPGQANRKIATAWDDKNYAERHQPDIAFPHTYVRNIEGWFLDHDYRPISREEAKRIMTEHLPLIVKPSIDSGEGKNLILVSDEKGVDEVFSNYDKDYLAQEVVKQCEVFKKTNPNSVNVMRIVTAIVDREAKLLTSMLISNTEDVIACNMNTAPGVGVYFLPIDEEGRFLDTAYYENAKVVKELPNGLDFAGMQIPAYKEAISQALEAHNSMPMLGVIGWDITIDENNKPLFFEWNLRGIGMYHCQLVCGPLFGEYTDYFVDIAKKRIKQRKL